MNFIKEILYKNIAGLISCSIFFALISCDEDLTKISKNKNTNFPSQIINNANIVQRDSGMIKLRAKAALIEKFKFIDSPYFVSRKGINILFYDKKKPDAVSYTHLDVYKKQA